MSRRLTFTCPASLTGLAAHATVERDLKRIFRRFGRDFLPRSIWEVANTLLAEKSNALMFTVKFTYREAMSEAIRREPHLALGLRPYLPDGKFGNVKIRYEKDTARAGGIRR